MKYVAYYRVSTRKQGRSGLGLEAQSSAVNDYVMRTAGELVEEFSEVESGANNSRPELERALRECRLKRATLLIAKLDRLTRNVGFLEKLKASGVKFVCCDMPEANELTIGLMAQLAEFELQLISERTKAALAAAVERGVQLGNPRLDEYRNTDLTKAWAARKEKSDVYKREILAVIHELDPTRDCSASEIARKLNQEGYVTAKGKSWRCQQVLRVLEVA